MVAEESKNLKRGFRLFSISLLKQRGKGIVGPLLNDKWMDFMKALSGQWP
jgi:hypothetical protein